MKKIYFSSTRILRGWQFLVLFLGISVALMIYPSAVPATGIDQYTTLMIQSRTYDGDTNFVDVSSSAQPISVYGDTHHSTLQAKFGCSSILFDGSGDYFEIPNSPTWNFGGGDFTIDLWIRPSDPSWVHVMQFGRDPVGEHSGDNSVSWGFEASVSPPYGTGFHFWGRKDDFTEYDYYSNTANLAVATWNHVAVVRALDELIFFLNGEEIFSTLMDFSIRSNFTMPLLIGARTSNDNLYYMDGFVEEIRISTGIARWTADFTPPTKPYGTAPVPEPATILLLASGLVGLVGLRKKFKNELNNMTF